MTPAARRFLVPVADDLGLSRGVNGGVIEAHERGIVTSAALLVNFPAFADAVEIAHRCANLSVGLHVNLTIGRPVTPWKQVSTLTNAGGEFLGLAGFIAREALGGVSRADLSIEIDAQFQRFEETGLRLDFVNGQHHVHLFRPIMELVAARLAGRDRMLRLTHETRRAVLSWPTPKRVVFAALARRGLARLDGLASNDGFVHVDASRLRRPVGPNPFVEVLSAATGAVNELMCHPAHVDLPLRYLDAYVDEREIELHHLCDPALRDAIRAAGLLLATYPEARAASRRP